jgi:uncharacterized alpha-E superfamily protein
MMLSRVADNLFWMSRYLERAEHTARLVDVTLDLMPDRSAEDNRRAWADVFTALKLSLPDFAALNANQLTQELTLENGNSGSIFAHIVAARENARQIREHISPEMWEQLNRLYLGLKHKSIKEMLRNQPHEFFQTVKEGTHLFQGITNSTMHHGEGWYFIQLGQFIERADNTAALLNIHLQDPPGPEQQAISTSQYLRWVSLLRSCTAFEAYCKVYTPDTRFDRIAEFLLLNAEFPHSIHFAVSTMRTALQTIAEVTDTPKNNVLNRQAGRMKAMLDYVQIDEVLSTDLHSYLDSIQQQCAKIYGLIYQTYINYPADQKLPV